MTIDRLGAASFAPTKRPEANIPGVIIDGPQTQKTKIPTIFGVPPDDGGINGNSPEAKERAAEAKENMRNSVIALAQQLGIINEKQAEKAKNTPPIEPHICYNA